MTGDEAFQHQIQTQIGSACFTIAVQAKAITELQNELAQAKATIAELEKKVSPLHAVE